MEWSMCPGYGENRCTTNGASKSWQIILWYDVMLGIYPGCFRMRNQMFPRNEANLADL